MKRAAADQWMPFYGARFFESERVVALEPAAQMLFVRCLWRQWTHGPLPSDDATLRRLFHEYAADWDQLWPTVKAFFRPASGGRLENDTLSEVRVEQQRVIERRRVGAVKTNTARWGAKAENVAQRSHSESPPISKRGEEREMRVEAEKKPARVRGSRGGTDLTRFWDAEWDRTRMGVKFDWAVADAVALAACAKKDGGADEVKRRITKLLESSDGWDLKHASPKELRRKWNELSIEVRQTTLRERIFAQADEMDRQDRVNGIHP
jgi:uncharacterized protein YdaU (DUF1376 family)